jgi:hypothetical protein
MFEKSQYGDMIWVTRVARAWIVDAEGSLVLTIREARELAALLAEDAPVVDSIEMEMEASDV